jgi:vanillate monooxygenase ferredoxin subunit
MTELTVTVAAVHNEADDVSSFELVASDGGMLPSFTAGSHIDVHVAPGVVRQYSLCNDPRESHRYVIAVKREPASRGGSSAMHQRVHAGDRITIGAPRNNFALVANAVHHLLIAGGIGITPLLAMTRQLLATNASFQLVYFSRSIENTAFHEPLSGPEYRGRVAFHYALEPDQVRAYLRKLLWHRAEGAHLYLCGPRPFMDLVEATAAPTWPPEAVHLEYFAADPAALGGPRDHFLVKLARQGGEFEIPAGRTIIEVLAENGIVVETSCEQGVCGTCLTGVLDGEPDHRDVFLSEVEKRAGDRMTVCVSRAKGARLVLDL